MMRSYSAFCLLFFLFWAGNAFAATIQFPVLTGRIVDNAHLLSTGATAGLKQALESHEQQTTNQVVVVTVTTLQGYTIEDFGYQLGRYWGIGQKDKNNGVLLIVAPKERKVRIEVGYGLEGKLTDAKASQIIQDRILPAFRSGNMEQGIVEGTQAILATLGGSVVEPSGLEALSQQLEFTSAPLSMSDISSSNDAALPHQPKLTPAQTTLDYILSFVYIGIFLVFIFLPLWCVPYRKLWPAPNKAFYAYAGRAGGSTVFYGGGGGFSGGTFGGGGGGFGGGGCSGGW